MLVDETREKMLYTASPVGPLLRPESFAVRPPNGAI